MVDTDTIYVDRRNNELLTSIGPYGPCGKRPMSCDSINNRSFRRSREPFISQQRKKKCLSRKNHPYHKCITELDANGNFIKCSKHDSETRDLPDTVPISHRMPSESPPPRQESRMINKLFTDKNILNFALRYDVCINIWNDEN